jgi:hypothetical protein
LDWQKNSNTKVAMAFFSIFMSSYAEMSFCGPKKALKRVKQIFFFKWVNKVLKIRIITLISKLGNIAL